MQAWPKTEAQVLIHLVYLPCVRVAVRHARIRLPSHSYEFFHTCMHAHMQVLEIIFDLPIGFPINNIISLSHMQVCVYMFVFVHVSVYVCSCVCGSIW